MADTSMVRFGHQKTITNAASKRVTLKADGKISASESQGVARVDGFVSDIRDERIKSFIKSRDASVFGSNWVEHTDNVADSGDNLVGRWGTQQITVDPKAREVVLDTQGAGGVHVIRGKYDGRSGNINPRTITEEYRPRSLTSDKFQAEWW